MPRASLILILAIIASVAASAECDRAVFRVALDVGHSPEAPGAINARSVEEIQLSGATRQSQIAAAMGEAIEAFCIWRPAVAPSNPSRWKSLAKSPKRT